MRGQSWHHQKMSCSTLWLCDLYRLNCYSIVQNAKLEFTKS